jgi:3D (Asp-Asp-Asp) domain-containing protein
MQRQGMPRQWPMILCMIVVACAGCAHYEERQFVITAYSTEQQGRTSSGTMPSKGTVAADTRYYPYGTEMQIPGYGKGVVRDTGGAIKGPERLDVYFPERRQAIFWGRKTLLVKVKKP